MTAYINRTKLVSMDKYKILAADYDLLNPKEEIFKQLPFFQKLIADNEIESCLDCACGTGWHLQMLAQLGVKCSGSDISPEMLAQAQTNLTNETIPLKQADFKELISAWNHQFDMVICMTTSFPHMLESTSAISALNSMYGALGEGGILVIANGITDSLLNAKPKLIPGRILRDSAFYFFLEYPNDDRIVFNILNVKKTEVSFEHRFESIEYNALRKSKLDEYFRATKFRGLTYFGDFKFSPYDEKCSEKLIAVARKYGPEIACSGFHPLDI